VDSRWTGSEKDTWPRMHKVGLEGRGQPQDITCLCRGHCRASRGHVHQRRGLPSDASVGDQLGTGRGWWHVSPLFPHQSLCPDLPDLESVCLDLQPAPWNMEGRCWGSCSMPGGL
jgi:hypothetical protein